MNDARTNELKCTRLALHARTPGALLDVRVAAPTPTLPRPFGTGEGTHTPFPCKTGEGSGMRGLHFAFDFHFQPCKERGHEIVPFLAEAPARFGGEPVFDLGELDDELVDGGVLIAR